MCVCVHLGTGVCYDPDDANLLRKKMKRELEKNVFFAFLWVCGFDFVVSM